MAKPSNNEDLGFERKLWSAADMLRNNMDAAEYKHVVLGLIFLKYISDSFEEKYGKLKKDTEDPKSGMYVKDPPARYQVLEDKDEYLAENIFYVPERARWHFIQSNAKMPEIGKIIDDAMDLIEKENTSLRDVLPKSYARSTLDKKRLGQLVDLISGIGLGDKESKSKDILGRVYEYFLGEFADAEGKKGGQFYTPKSIVKTLVYMLRPFKGRVYDPCCGSGGMFVQSEKFIEEHQGRLDNVSVWGQESNPTTWKLCKMNLAIRHIDNDRIALGDTFHQDKNPELRADYILANPPFNISDWDGESLREDKRWKYGIPPVGNANFAWVQHMIYHLAPRGVAGFVLANGSMSSNTSGEGEIRKNVIEADLVDCIVALPSQLFYNTMIPACLWFIRKDKEKRKGEVLFIDARNLGIMINRRNKDLTQEEVIKISDTYHAWRGEPLDSGKQGKYEDVKGFSKSASLDEIRKHEHILTPGRYVGITEEADDGEPFEDKMARLTKELAEQFKEGEKLELEIKKNLSGLGWRL
ncbi:SAM-dependent DNA methyltransferase [Candidatus Pacearchaeota archaeon]|nr:SAM-dependent DNA methyltransferase [Candidatus Pacearchaeota archaeon]